MTMLEVHANALNCVNITYHEFLLRYKASENIVYGIVEGKEDPMFYRSLIERCLPAGWEIELIPAGNKDNVIRTISEFNWSAFSRKRICFFVDRDLSEFIPETLVISDNLYITDNYSIENDLINFGVLRRLLEEVLNVSNLTPAELNIIESIFYSSLSSFREAMLPIMAQIVIWRRSDKKPCLNDIRPKDIFRFKDGNIMLRSEQANISSRVQYAARCVNLTPADQNDLYEVEAEFRIDNRIEKYVRGKYLMWFIIEHALELHRSVFLILNRFSAPPKVRVSLGAGNAMVIVAPRGRCPNSLGQFLERTYVQFVRETSEFCGHQT